jgi:hypothetical protein
LSHPSHFSCGRETHSLTATTHTRVAVENEAARFTRCFSTTLPHNPRSTTLGPRSSVSHTMKIFRSLFFVLLFFETYRSRAPGGGGDRHGCPLFGKLVASASEVLSGGSSTAEPAAVDDDPTYRLLPNKSGGGIKEEVCNIFDGPGEVETGEAEETTAKEVGTPVARLPGSKASTERSNGRPLGAPGGGEKTTEWRIGSKVGFKDAERAGTSGMTEAKEVEYPASGQHGSLVRPKGIMSAAEILRAAYQSSSHVRSNLESVVKSDKEPAPGGLWVRLRQLAIVCAGSRNYYLHPGYCAQASSLLVRRTCGWSDEELLGVVRDVLRRGASGGDSIMLAICTETKANLARLSLPSVRWRPAESLDGEQFPRGTLEILDCF